MQNIAKAKKLSQFAQGRDNNFNLIRFIAALAVLVSHSYGAVMVAGTGDDPLAVFFGASHVTTMGTIAVDIFFITSGFLVTGSLIARKSTLQFVRARVLRIYPALVVAVFLMIFVLGLYFTTYPAASFLTNHETLDFAFHNITLISGVRYRLPGVFDSLADGGSINIPLWTMVSEMRMYALLAIMWPALYVLGKLRVKAFTFCVVSIAVLSFLVRFAGHYYFHFTRHTESLRFLFLFFTGAAYFVLKERIILSRTIFWLTVAGLLVSALKFEVFFAVYNIVLPYVLLWIAYLPAGPIRSFNRLGDYSYGVYIYSFPIQQSIVALFPGISLIGMMLFSSVATLFFASLSWHLIEKHALSLKGSFAKAPARVIGPEPTVQATPAG